MGFEMPWYSAQESADALLAGRWFGMHRGLPAGRRPVFETYWSSGRGREVMAPAYGLLDMTVYGRQETWEDSPEGWPKPLGNDGDQFRLDGRPTAQWSRLAAGRFRRPHRRLTRRPALRCRSGPPSFV